MKLIGGNDAFFDVTRSPVATSEGAVTLPVLYYDASVFISFYRVQRGAAQLLLQETQLDAVSLPGNQALAAVSFFNYRESSLGAYNEAAVALAVVRRGVSPHIAPMAELFGDMRRRTLGFYVVDLAVDSVVACAEGREIFGYPKFLTEMGWSHKGRAVEAMIADPDGDAPLLTLAGQRYRGLPGPLINFQTYSYWRGRELAAFVDTQGLGWYSRGRGLLLSAEANAHPMVKRLNTLGLSSAVPDGVIYSDGVAILRQAATLT